MKEKDIKETKEVLEEEEKCSDKKKSCKSKSEKFEKSEKSEKSEKKSEDPLKVRIAELEAKTAELEAGIAKEKDDYIRLMAEFENFRRRTAAERLELISTASEKIILEILPTLDDCERAMKALGESSDAAAAKEGTELIYTKLLNTLKAKGLKEIDAQDKTFDTEMMEAVAQFPVQEEEKKGKVFDVVQKGYTLGEKVIRYAKVVVGQ